MTACSPPNRPPPEIKYHLTEDQLRFIVFSASVAYTEVLTEGRSVQEAELMRLFSMRNAVANLPDF